jgi:hypothetical protein
MEGVQGSGAPHQPPTHTGVGFSGVVMMPVLSTRTRYVCFFCCGAVASWGLEGTVN